MSKRQLFWSLGVLLILAGLAALLALRHIRSSNQSITSKTYQIGQDLIAHATSPQLVGLPPGLAGQLSNLLSSPAQVSAVLLGDEPPPVGDGSACSRLILTNQLTKGLELRLCPASVPDTFRILGYWPTSANPGLR